MMNIEYVFKKWQLLLMDASYNVQIEIQILEQFTVTHYHWSRHVRWFVTHHFLSLLEKRKAPLTAKGKRERAARSKL